MRVLFFFADQRLLIAVVGMMMAFGDDLFCPSVGRGDKFLDFNLTADQPAFLVPAGRGMVMGC